jgi:flagellar biosynthesis/type III secretory pathway M-ring protein FliF/YscJ
VIYRNVFKLLRQMTIGEAIVVAIAVIAALFMWSKSRDRSGY